MRLFLAAILASCLGARTGTKMLPDDASVAADGGDAAAGEGGVAVNGCAPNDAPALMLTFQAGDTCAMQALRGVVLTMWGPDLPQGPKKITFPTATASAQLCTGPNACTPGAGTLNIKIYNLPNGQAVIGSYDLTFGATHMTNPDFTLPQCNNKPLCG